MSVLSPRGQQLLQKPAVQNLLVISLVTGAVSSAAAAYIVGHVDPNSSVKKEVKTAIFFGALSTLLSVGYKFWKAEKKSGLEA